MQGLSKVARKVLKALLQKMGTLVALRNTGAGICGVTCSAQHLYICSVFRILISSGENLVDPALGRCQHNTGQCGAGKFSSMV
jgi:hypothetical protein